MIMTEKHSKLYSQERYFKIEKNAFQVVDVCLVAKVFFFIKMGRTMQTGISGRCTETPEVITAQSFFIANRR